MRMVGSSACFEARTSSVRCTRRTPTAQFLRVNESRGAIAYATEDGGNADMGERIEETKGNIKEGVGKLTGNEEMQAEGRAEKDTAKAKREVKGAAESVKGRVTEGLGKVTGDDETRARGMADRIKGDTERAG
jgi:uncharacterized protein YjbJ (UPF0337 family)